MVQDLLAGNIDLWFGSTDQLPLVRAGSIKAYAGDRRDAPGGGARHTNL